MRPVALATSLIVALALGGAFSGAVHALDTLDDGPSASDSAAPGGVKSRHRRTASPAPIARGETGEPPVDAAQDFPDQPPVPPQDDQNLADRSDEAPVYAEQDERPRYRQPSDDTSFEDTGSQSRGDIRRVLNDQGFSEVNHLRRRGGVFIAEVIGPMGDRMRVVVDAQTGDIQGLRVLERAGNGLDRRAELNFLEQ
jgi:hypothetical protein